MFLFFIASMYASAGRYGLVPQALVLSVIAAIVLDPDISILERNKIRKRICYEKSSLSIFKS